MDHLETAWRTQALDTAPDSTDPKVDDYVNVQNVIARARQNFATWRGNGELRQYLSNLVDLIDNETVQPVEMAPYHYPKHAKCGNSKRGLVSFQDLLSLPPGLDVVRPDLRDLTRTVPGRKVSATHIIQLVETLRLRAKSRYEKWYVD